MCEQMITDDGGVIKTFIELDLKEFEDDDDNVDEKSTLELIEKEVYDAVSVKQLQFVTLFLLLCRPIC